MQKIVPGYRIGKLTVSASTQKRKSGYNIWCCKCECGGEIELDTRTLQRGTVRDCGCTTKVKPGQRNLTGMRFGRLIAKEPTQQRGHCGAVIWHCQCDCGKEVYTESTQLTKGYKKSCGCLGHPPIKNFIGERFGELTVQEYMGKQNGMHYWRCICDCGNTTVVGQTLLQSGKTKSCGCLQSKVIFENLRLVEGTSVTILESVMHRRSKANTSGFTGVYYNQRSHKWIANIGFKGRNIYLGSYDRIEDAVSARKQAEQRIYGEFLRWYYENYQESTPQDI